MMETAQNIQTAQASSARIGWCLTCPPPAAGRLAEGVYYTGAGLADDTGTVAEGYAALRRPHELTDADFATCLASFADPAWRATAVAEDTEECSKLQLVTQVTEADFAAYLARLGDAGYRLMQTNCWGNNRYAALTGAGCTLQISYIAGKGELRVAEDVHVCPLDEFANAACGDTEPVLYQYGLYYDPENRDNTHRTTNCGMLYILRLSDNSLILVDGGHIYQSSNETIDGLMTFLHQITGTADGEPVRVAAWYITHAHGDHVAGVAKLLNRHHRQIDLQRVMYNIPSYRVRPNGYDSMLVLAKAILRRYYPAVRYLKLHTGQSFRLSDVLIDVLYTHEDAVGPGEFAAAADRGDLVRFPLRDFNCTSSVIRITVQGKTVMMLADTNTEAEAIVQETFPAAVWKSDVVQIAHHCFNYLNALYPMIAAPVALMPNSYYGSHTPDNTPKLESVLAYVENGQIYYEGAGTVGLAVRDGAFRVIYEAPVVGGEYDGSGI